MKKSQIYVKKESKMKRRLLIVPFMILTIGASSLYADQIPREQQKTVVTKIRSIEDIAQRIRESQEYLEKLPAELDEIKHKFQKLTSMGNEIEAKISRYLKFMDTCSTRELKYEGAKQCRLIISASLEEEGKFDDILNAKRKQIQNALSFIEREKQRIKAEMSEGIVVKEGIDVLNDVKDVLTLDV